MRILSVFAISVMIASYSSSVQSFVSGKLDTLLETEQTNYYSRSRIEQQVDINWRNIKNTLNAGLQFDLKHEIIEDFSQNNDQNISENKQQINLLFVSHEAADINYTLGRFNRSDFLGYYTLDGVSAKYSKQNWDTHFHAGKPLQIEDYITIDADRIYGIDINHHTNHNNNSIVKKTNSHIGWQQIQDNTRQNYIHMGISANGELSKHDYNQLELFFNGSYLTENKSAESINAGAQVQSKELGMARIAYNSWKPEQANLSFKEQFYSVYANGEQSILQADLFHNYKWGQQYYIRGRKVWREFGNNGFGTTIGFEQKLSSKENSGWLAQWDSLILKGDIIHSVYLGLNKNISATFRGHLNTALQYTDNKSTDTNSLLALEAVVEQMLNSALFIDFNARYIYNQNFENEYRIGFRLSYRFDDRIWSGK